MRAGGGSSKHFKIYHKRGSLNHSAGAKRNNVQAMLSATRRVTTERHKSVHKRKQQNGDIQVLACIWRDVAFTSLFMVADTILSSVDRHVEEEDEAADGRVRQIGRISPQKDSLKGKRNNDK